MRKTAIAALALWLVASMAWATGPVRELAPTKDALIADGAVGTTSYLFGSGFEPGEGYAIGTLEPQLGWTATGINLPFASISNANPFTGTQHIRLIDDPAAANG